MQLRGLALAASLLCFATGCGGGDDENAPKGGDEYEAVLFPSTHVLDDAAMKALSAYDADGTLHFDGTPAALADIAELQVVIGGQSTATPSGLLRVVTQVESDSAGLVLRTSEVPIQFAFRKLHVKLARTIDDIASPDVPGDWMAKRPMFSDFKHDSKDFQIPIGNGDQDTGSDDDQVLVTGTLGGGISYSFDLDVDWGDVLDVPGELKDCLAHAITSGSCSVTDLLPEAIVHFSAKVDAEAQLGMKGVAFLGYDAPYELAEVPLPKFPVGLLLFEPTLQVKAKLSGKASSQFAFDIGAQASAGLSVDISSKHAPNPPKPTADWSFSAPLVDATLQAGGRVEAGPEVHLRLYGIAGPWASLSAFAELSADQTKTPCYELHAGVDASFGFDIVTPDLPLIGHASLAEWGQSYELFNEVVDSGACKPLPGGDAPSPTGGDPDAASFANPKFTPWSRTYADAAAFHPFGGPGAGIKWMDAVPSIDGRFTVAGSDSRALLSLNPDGTVAWARRYLGPVDFYDDTLNPELMPSRVLPLGDGSMLVIAHPYTLMALEADGTLIWSKQFDLTYLDATMRLTDVAPAPDGGFFVGGTTGDSRSYPELVDAWLMRFDQKGDLTWSRRWGTAADGETLRSLTAFEGGVVAGGATWIDAESGWRAWTVRFDADGNVVWSKGYDARACGSTYAQSAFVTSGLVAKDGDLILAGAIPWSRGNTLIMKLKPDGTMAWFASDEASDPVNYGPSITRIVALPTSGYLISGLLDYSEAGVWSDSQQDLFLAATDGVGKVQWLRRYGGHGTYQSLPTRDDAYAGVTLTHDGGALLVGYTDSLEHNGIWAMKVPAKDGLIDFAPAGSAVSELVAVGDAGNCVTQSDAPIAPSAFDQTPKPLEIKTEKVTLQGNTQLP
jgi:hypothetical protein